MDAHDRARLESHVLRLLDEDLPVRLADLRREFPQVEEADIERVRSSAQVLFAWLGELGRRNGAGGVGRARDWLAPGERLGGYFILRRLPGGGMGQVYQAVQESLYPRQVALKVYRLGAAPEKELRRARREAEIASRLLHPHLVAIHDLGHDEARGLAFFSMQFIDGHDLREELRGVESAGEGAAGRARVRRLVTRVSEVAGALAELHAQGYVHRDVKPDNILLRSDAGRDGRAEAAVLVDFGLVRAERALRSAALAERGEEGGSVEDSASSSGALGYIPPEGDRPGHAVTPAWDVYSLGVVLYELLRGRPLPRDPRGAPLRPDAAQLARLRSAVPAVDADLAAVVGCATREDPAARYADAAALQADLERWLGGEPVSVRRAPLAERLWRDARRHPRRTLSLALVLPLVPLSAWLVAGELAHLRRGTRALERGELRAGWEHLGSAAAPYLRALPAGPPGLKRDLLQGTREHPISRVVQAERDGGTGAALELAAAYLQRDGWHADGVPNHPELVLYLSRSLAHPASDGVRARGLATLARLFSESPIQDPRSLELAGPLRARLVELLAGSLPLGEGLDAACALGGSGDAADVELLLEWGERAGDEPEVARLGLHSSQRVVRRLRLIGRELELAPTDRQRIEERARALGQRWLGSEGLDGLDGVDGTGGVPLRSALAEWVEAWALLRRALGDPIPAGSWDPIALGAGGANLGLRAALDPTDPELLAALAEGPPFGRGVDGIDGIDGIDGDEGDEGVAARSLAHSWGRRCAYTGDESLQRGALERLAGHPVLLESFRAGWNEGAQAVRLGPEPALLPDPASHLSHLLEPADPGPYELVLPQGANPAAAGTLAAWDFTRERARSGSALELRAGGGTRPEDFLEGRHWPHLRLPRPGAFVEAVFTVPEPHARARRSLHLRHLAAQRPYVPFQGVAWVRVELNGLALAERLLVRHKGSRELSLPIERQALLTPGPHVLRITLLEATTTYWIEELRLAEDP